MLRAFDFNSDVCLKARLRKQKSQAHFLGLDVFSGGFTLVETIVSALLLALLVASTASLFTTATQSVRRTGVLAEANAAIDTDISRIRELIERYTYCTGTWSTSPGSPCNAVPYVQANGLPNSYYYFPATASDIPAFFAACEASSASAHLTAPLITAMNALTPSPTGGVTRLVERVNASDPSNHLIRVTYSSQKVARQVVMRPVVSSWCR